jgi:tetratricopeptide (TPR) repeat protein
VFTKTFSIAVFAFAVSPLGAFAGDAEDCRNEALKASRVEACSRLIDEYENRDEGLAKLYDLRAAAHGAREDFPAQAEDFGSALRLRPPSPEGLLKRGGALFRAGETESALVEFNSAVVMDPQNAAARLWRGRAFRKLEQLANAETDLNLAVTLDPKNPNVWMVRGLLRDDQKRHADAIADYDQAAALAPESLTPVYNRAWAKSQLGQHAQALADLEICRRIDPDDADCLDLRAQTLAAMKDHKGAAQSYAQAIARAPNVARLRRARAEVLRVSGDFDGAIKELTSALEIDADMTTLYDRGWAYALSGRPDNAIADYSLILRREGADTWPAALIERGLARIIRGDLTAAAQDLDSARSVAPGNVRAALWRAALAIRRDRESFWASWRRSDTVAALSRERPKLKAERYEAPFVQALLGERSLAEAHRVAHVAAKQSAEPAEAACFADAMAGALAIADGDRKSAERYYANAAARGAPTTYMCLIASAELNRIRAR